jgi:serine/threonine protein kinase/Flp pilus assembly protein TadD
MSAYQSLDQKEVWRGKAADGGESVSFVAARGIKRGLLAEYRAGMEKGASVRPEDVLPRWPTNPKDDLDFASFLFEDYQQRRRRGEQPSVDEYNRRFPEHKDSLSQLVSRHEFLLSFSDGSDSKGPLLGLPEVGDEVFGFRLRGELGRGAFARVFMAEQANLAGRPVVLKVSGIDGDEPYTLAQLQHTNVVPIYSVHEDSKVGLRAVCMPYFGGASLSSVLKPLWAEGAVPTEGSQLVAALRSVQAPSLEVLARQSTDPADFTDCQSAGQRPLDRFNDLNYVSASAWIVARLAEGLQHAHQRGVLHRDIKPSNILLGADGQPMLLDFNLAQNRHAHPSQAEATLGGTVAYMAPEHLRALARPSPATAREVDQRSDIYSLGMVLYEMLTGHSPFDQSASYSILPVMIEAMAVERSQAAPSVRRHQPGVPWSMESIVGKCLSPEPARRYQQAEELAEDLRRFLEDQPLKHAPEPSRAERLRKWVRRHPRLTSSSSVATVAVLLLVGAGATLAGVREHLASAREELEGVQARERKQAYDAGHERTLCLVNTVADLQDHLAQGRQTCEQTLALYGVLERSDWQQHPAWQRLNADDRLAVAENTRELLLLLAWARVQSAPQDTDVVRDAVALLDKADAIQGLKPSKAVWMDRARYLDKLGDKERAEAAKETAERIEPASARDCYLLAITSTRQGTREGVVRAIGELNRALQLNPRHYWSLVQRGICYQELGEPTLAASDFGTCIGVWPEFPWGHFNKSCILDRSGKKVEAVQGYTDALKYDPKFLLAYVNRALARLELKQYADALADFDQAFELGQDDVRLHTGRGTALEGLGRFQEADEAFGIAFDRIASTEQRVRNDLRLVYGFAVCARLPDKARAVFDDLLQDDPAHADALYGLAMVAVQQGQAGKAIKYYDRALTVNPRYIEARRYRAILLARSGRFEQAVQDINQCLEQEPRGGATLYAAACVTALMAAQTHDRTSADQAVDLLQKAVEAGYGRDKAVADPDLASIRKHPQFQELLPDSEAGGQKSEVR